MDGEDGVRSSGSTTTMLLVSVREEERVSEGERYPPWAHEVVILLAK